MTILLSFFSTVPCLVTSPSAECSYNHSTLLCRLSIVFSVFLGDVYHLHSTLPSKTVSAKFPALPLVTCPKYCSFIRATFPINSLSRPISSNIDIFQEIPSIFLQHNISKDSILFLSDFFNVRPSTPYWNTAQTIDFITLIFNADVTFLSFQMVVSSTAFWHAIDIRKSNALQVLSTRFGFISLSSLTVLRLLCVC